MHKPLISVCIPSYNRPEKLYDLLGSVNSIHNNEIEIVICEDKSPKREEIRKKAEEFKGESKYSIIYKENEENLGYDKNLKELIKNATGKWIIFMGDDDQFVPGALDKIINFLKNNDELGYLLRAYYTNNNGKIEKFRYYKEKRFFEPGRTLLLNFLEKVFLSPVSP